MRNLLGRPLREALSENAPGETPVRIAETAAPLRAGQTAREGTARIIACRPGEWIVARFQDGLPREKEDV